MKIEQMYTGCLAQAAYYIESNGEVAIIDPLRETEPYIEKATASGASIKYIFETHFHADFVTGCVTLAEKTGAQIVYGPTAAPEYSITQATDGELFQLGAVQIKAIHTPGHTQESTTYMVIDESGNNHALFTGDTLFLGDVGRPDLSVKSDKSKEDLARDLYDSLYNKLVPLSDDLIVYPGHGAGSACGKNMSKETVGTLGQQKEENYALANLTEEDFVEQVTKGLSAPPQYFPKNAALNKQGAGAGPVLAEVPSIDVHDLEQVVHDGNVIILDTRTVAEFGMGHIPKSINFPLNGQFASWVGTLVTDLSQKIVLVANDGEVEDSVKRLARVGYDSIVGIVAGGFSAWQESGNPVGTIEVTSPAAFAEIAESVQVIDVRNRQEWKSQHLKSKNVVNIPLEELSNHMHEISEDTTYYLHCAGGYRSMIAASILQSRGYTNLVNVNGGFNGIVQAGAPVTDYVCPTTLV